MKLYHVVAMTDDRVIGKNNKLPWHFSVDLKNFKELTTGQTVIMGRKTFESIGKPLPGRENFVLTHNPKRNEEHLRFFTNWDEAMKHVMTPKAFIIGGAGVYRQTLDKIDGIYLTKIYARYEGDAYYPKIPDQFVEKEKKTLQENPEIELIYLENTGRGIQKG